MNKRPTYESREDRQNEMDVFRQLPMKTTPKKLPLRYEVDFAMVDGEAIRCFVEIKCRTHAYATYPTLMISMAKMISGITLSGMTGLPFWLVVRWTDKIGAVEIDNLREFKTGIGGRTDRDDDQDVEPVVHIPVSRFKILAPVV